MYVLSVYHCCCSPPSCHFREASWNDLFESLVELNVKGFPQFTPICLGPVVQNFVSLTLSLSPHSAKYILTSKANTLLFCVEIM